MKTEMRFLRDDRDYGDDDEIHVSDDDDEIDDEPYSDDSDSSFDPTLDSSEEDSGSESTNNANQGQIDEAQASTSTSRDDNNIDEFDDEEDEVVKAILKSREIHRDHPPAITLEDTLADICFHPVEDIIAFASISGDVFLYKYSNEENRLASTLELHEEACRDIEFNEDGSILYSTGKDCTVLLSDVKTEKLTRIFENAHEHPIYSMTVLDENTFVTGDDEGTVKMWDLRQKESKPVFSLKEMEDFVSAMVTNDDKKYLVCSSGDGTLTTIDIRVKKLHVRTEDYPQELTCLGLFRHGRKILVGGNKGNLFLFNWGEFGLHSDEIPSLTKKSINCMIPITENVVVCGGEDKVLRATSIFPNRQLGIVGQHDLSVECLDICNNGSLIASYSYDNSVKFWNVSYFETLNTTKPIKGGKKQVLKHNLPSSKLENASDFFADL